MGAKRRPIDIEAPAYQMALEAVRRSPGQSREALARILEKGMIPYENRYTRTYARYVLERLKVLKLVRKTKERIGRWFLEDS